MRPLSSPSAMGGELPPAAAWRNPLPHACVPPHVESQAASSVLQSTAQTQFKVSGHVRLKTRTNLFPQDKPLGARAAHLWYRHERNNGIWRVVLPLPHKYVPEPLRFSWITFEFQNKNKIMYLKLKIVKQILLVMK